MSTLDALVREASARADGRPATPSAAEAEVARQLQICNACRYCEGFCAVFPAMARRLEFGPADVHYLANLCHNCGACLHACQYAPPHEFAVALPTAMATVRGQTYADHAWPQALSRLYQRNGLTLALALAGALAFFLALGAARQGSLWGAVPAGSSFYAIFPHGLMVALFLPVFAFAVLALGIGVARFWREAPPGAASTPAVQEAVGNALTLKYLDGGHGQGCNEADDRFTLVTVSFMPDGGATRLRLRCGSFWRFARVKARSHKTPRVREFLLDGAAQAVEVDEHREDAVGLVGEEFLHP